MLNNLIRQITTSLRPTGSISTIHLKVKEMVSRGLYEQTLDYYKEVLHLAAPHANASILPSVIKACSSLQHYCFALQLHCIVLKSGLDSDPVISNAVVSMYAKTSHLVFARKVFDAMPQRDTISWNSIINGYIQNGFGSEPLVMFKEMYDSGFIPKSELIACLITHCLHIGDLTLGRIIHALVIVDGRIEDSVFVLTSLVNFYSKCHDSLMALRVFGQMEVKNEVSWTAMISGCSANLDYYMALECFQAMQINGVKPNQVTLLAILPTCAALGCLKHGKEIHGFAFRHGFDSYHQLSASLIQIYCGSEEGLHDAKIIFERTKHKDVVLWSSIIGGYSQSGDSVEAMKLFRQMRIEGIKPNSVTLLAVITACIRLNSFKLAQAIHGYIMKHGWNFEIVTGNALINMYSKCGSLMSSHQIFNEMHLNDSISWSALISSYGLHGYGEEALSLFLEMQSKGLEPDAITFLIVLSACNHSGLVDEGQEIFNNTKKVGNIPLSMEHYACEIDILGKSGKIEDAFLIVRTMPLKPNAKIWSSLVSACKIHGRLDTAEMLARLLINLEPWNAAHYTLLSMIYAELGNWAGVEEVRRLMSGKKLMKCCGFSQISG